MGTESKGQMSLFDIQPAKTKTKLDKGKVEFFGEIVDENNLTIETTAQTVIQDLPSSFNHLGVPKKYETKPFFKTLVDMHRHYGTKIHASGINEEIVIRVNDNLLLFTRHRARNGYLYMCNPKDLPIVYVKTDMTAYLT